MKYFWVYYPVLHYYIKKLKLSILICERHIYIYIYTFSKSGRVKDESNTAFINEKV